MKNIQTHVAEAPLLNIEGLSRDLGKVVIVAPHPDDESLGCGGLIAHLTAQNASVRVIFLTNGEASHPNSRKFLAKDLGNLRKLEAINACTLLGLAQDDLTFLNAGDGKLAGKLANNDSLVKELNHIFEQQEPDTIFVPWRRDHHIDHVTAYKLVLKATKNLKITIAEYPIWLWKKGKPMDWPTHEEVSTFRLKIDTVKEIKKTAIKAHTSQTTTLIDDDPQGFILTHDLLEPFLGNYEYFFFPAYSKPAVKDSYFEELYANDDDPWNFETSTYEQEKYQKTIAAFSGRTFNKALEIGCSNGVFTKLFAPKCNELLAIDISAEALNSAKKRCAEFSHCEFKQWDIAQGVPEKDYDAIVLSEVGYYFELETLKSVFNDIIDALIPGGVLVMVHWTAYVQTYPLTGLQVHENFRKNHSDGFKLLNSERAELYILEVWEKTSQ